MPLKDIWSHAVSFVSMRCARRGVFIDCLEASHSFRSTFEILVQNKLFFFLYTSILPLIQAEYVPMDVAGMSTFTESSPLTLEHASEIAALLSSSLSPERQKQCEEALKAMEGRANFASCLLELLIRRGQVERSARWLASVYLKNVVVRNWRTRLQGCISAEEKERVRQGLIELIDEPDPQVGVQIALAVSKVARFDYPKEWPDVVERLVGIIRQARGRIREGSDGEAAERVLQRSYMALHLVLKELGSKRLASDLKTFEGLCSGLYETLVGWWTEDCGSLRPEIQERMLLEMKCVKRVLVQGFPSDAKSLQLAAQVQALCPFLVATLRSWLLEESEYRRSLALKLLKMVHAVQETHCWSFAASGSLVPYLELLCGEVARVDGSEIPDTGINNSNSSSNNNNGHLDTPEKRQRHKRTLTAIHSVVKCPGYRGSSSSLLMPAGKARELKHHLERMAEEIGATLKQFWVVGERDALLLTLLVRRFFVLTPNELALWDASGEEFHQETEHAAQEETVRGCAELLFNALLESNREALSAVVLNMMRQYGSSDLADPRIATETAAVMHAVSLGAYDLYDHMDFTEVLHGWIVPIVSQSDHHPRLRQVRREALRLVAYWVPKIKPQDKPTVYAMLLSILPEEDSAMFLMACSTLQAVMEDWDFDVEQFRPLATDAVRLLIADLARCSDYESQLEVFSVLNLVIDHLQERAKECAPMILQMIPQLWHDSEGQGLLRIQILLALQRLVHALGSESPMTYPVVLPILQFVIDANNPDPVNALEDVVCLWIVVLRHAPGPMDGLVSPLGGLLRIMQGSTEQIFTGTRCITSSVLLYGDALLETHGRDINSVLGGYVGNIKDKALTDIVFCLDVIVQMCPRQGLSFLADTIVAIVLDVLDPERGNQVIAPFLSLVVSRLAIRSPEDLTQLFEYACTTRGPDVAAAIERHGRATGSVVSAGLADDTMNGTVGANGISGINGTNDALSVRLFACLLDLWLDKFDSIASGGMRKLAALGLSALLKLHAPFVAPRFGEIVVCIAAVCVEVEQGPDSDSLALSFPVAGTGPRDDFVPVSVDLEEAEGETARREALFAESPIVRLGIKEHFQQCMHQAAHSDALRHAAVRLDEPTRKMLDDLLRAS